jgi:hypothetical protein
MSLRPIFSLASLQTPEQGPKGIYTPFLFNTQNSQNIIGDLASEQQSGAFEAPQTIWIDNRFNAQPVEFQFLGLPLVIQVRAGRQGVYPLVCANGIVRWSANSAQTAVDVPAIMFNVALQPWWQDV